jgi:hypothetical protein
MITMGFRNWSKTRTLTNPITDPSGPTDHVIHSPGPTLPPGASDSYQVDQTLGGVLNVGELPLMAYETDTTADWFVVVASLPVKVLGVNPFQDPSWMYWIGTGSWPAPGKAGWTIGTTSSVTGIAWGPSLIVNVSPTLSDAIVLDIGFHDSK